MKKILTRLGRGAIVVAVLVLAIGCAPGQKASDGPTGAALRNEVPAAAEIAVQVIPVEIGDLVVQHQTSGTIKPVMQSQVVGRGSGVVARVARQAGDWVNKDDLVIQLDDSQLRLSVRTAQATLEAARINLSTGQDTTKQANPRLDLQVRSAQSAFSAAQSNYDARKALFDLGGATSSDVQRAKSDLDNAEANLEAARTALDQNQKADVQNIAQLKLAVDQADFALQQAQLNFQHAAITAPYAGWLVAVNVMPGELVGQNAPAFILASREREVVFDVPPPDATSLPIGTSITFVLNGNNYLLKVTRSPEIPLNGVVRKVAAIPGSLPLSFGAVGMLSYSIILAHGVIIPVSAIQANENQNFVFTISGGYAAIKPITILGEIGAAAAVRGIQSGSRVVLYPPPGLLDGSQVQAVRPTGQSDDQFDGPVAPGQAGYK
jgi:multidrug efflux pump subunit AcrA (membrane-fusion protein)